MTRRELYLGLDAGTQGAKGVVVDAERGVVVARAASAYGLIEGLPAGAAEQHPQTWARGLREVVAKLVASGLDAARLGGIGVSAQQHGLVVLDEKRAVVRPTKLWCDTSTAGEARELSDALGTHVPAGFTASKVLWLARNEPESWRRTRHVLLPHDWINAQLCGELAMEAGDASGTGFFDARARRFDERAMRAIDAELPGRVPRLVEAGAKLGELTADGSRWLRLPASAMGALVATGGGDNMASAIGAGATRPGVGVLSLGTSATVFAFSAQPIVDPRGLIAPFCDSTGAWLPLLCVMNATGVLEEVRAGFDASFETLTREAELVPAGCDGLLFVPHLLGERVPDLPQASGTLHGLRAGSLRRGRVFRAALEGTALNIAWGVARLRELGLSLDSLRAAGGGARNDLWLAIVADCANTRVQRLVESESAALGAALQALWTARRARGERVTADEVAQPWIRLESRVFEPNPARARLYAEQLERFVELCRRVNG